MNNVYFYVNPNNVKYRTDKGIGIVFNPELLSLETIPNDSICWLPKSVVKESVEKDGTLMFDIPLWLAEKNTKLLDSVFLRSDDNSVRIRLKRVVKARKQLGGVLDLLNSAELSITDGESAVEFADRLRNMLIETYGRK